MTRKHRLASLLFLQGLQELGWSEPRNLQIDYRWGMGDIDRHRKTRKSWWHSRRILVHGGTIMGPLQRVTRTVPIVFVSVADPVAGGFVASFARPGGNATGFTSADYSMSGKWLERLNQMAPNVARAGVIRDPDQVSGGGQLGAIQAVAHLFGMEARPIGVRDAEEIESAIVEFARQPNGGLIVTTSALAQIHRELIITLAARHRLPAVYPYRLFVTSGGLMPYGSPPVSSTSTDVRRGMSIASSRARSPPTCQSSSRSGSKPQDRGGARSRRAVDAPRVPGSGRVSLAAETASRPCSSEARS
jgi:putative ABC transport system substrate-binding protein